MSLEALQTSILKDSFWRFAQAAWPVIEGAPLMTNWHLEAMCLHLQSQLTDEHSPENLLINVPPGTGKSLFVAVFAPAWLWLKDPTKRMVFASGTPSVVTRDSLKCRNLIKSDWYQSTFRPQWGIAKDQDEKQSFATTKGGFRIGLGAGGSVTGIRADWLVVDDPNDAKEVHSKAAREAINERWWASSFHNRVATPGKSRRTIIMQRLHEEDLAGFVLDREAGSWAHLSLPMEFDPEGKGDQNNAGGTWLGWKDPRKKQGELLFPERFTPEYLDGERKALGSAGYAGQMQQRPAPAMGNKFKREWWRFWSPTGVASRRPVGCTEVAPKVLNIQKARFDEIIGSWDATFKDTDDSDYVVGIVVGRIGADRYVLARKRERMGFSDTQRAIVQQRKDWPQMWEILIEDKANGSAIIETLSGLVTGIVAVNPMGGKEARAAALEPEVEAGNWYLPEGAEWLDEWIEEFASFPKGKNDDQVDATSQASIKMKSDTDEASARALLGIK